MPLTDGKIRTEKPSAKPRKLFDANGLYLLVQPNGGKWWRFRYRFDGKEKLLSLGTYPDVPLRLARERRDEARRALARGIDPGAKRKAAKELRAERGANSFELIAREWFAGKAPGWAKGHSEKVIRRLERDVFPWVGERPIGEIGAPELLTVARRIESRGALDTAHRALQNCGQVFRYAVTTGKAKYDPTVDLFDALIPATTGHFAAVTDPLKVGAILRKMDEVHAGFVVKCALRLMPLLFVRPVELRMAEWEQIDLERAEWQFQAAKKGPDHLVPLALQAVAILRDLYALTGRGRYVFPGRDQKKPMSSGAVNVALRRAGIDTRGEQTGHGFRAMARTLLHERLGIAPEVIEHQLAHRVPDALGTAYNRTRFIDQRREMMQQWADYLDRLRDGADMIPFRESAT